MNQENNSFRQLAKTCSASFTLLLVAQFSFGLAKADALVPDNGFIAPNFAKATPPERAVLLPDGKYLLFFDPDTLTDQVTGAITRFMPDGTLDASFNFSREYKTVSAAVPTGDGKLYVAATRFLYGTKDVEQILRLNDDGSIDSTFTPASVGGTHSDPDVYQMLLQPDGKLLVVGLFQTFGGDASRIGVVRLLSDGIIDSSFAADAIFGLVYSVALQADGKIVIGGRFTSVGGNPYPSIARLNSNGSEDPSFQPSGFAPTFSSVAIREIALQPDGMIVAGGPFRITSSFPLKRMPVIRLSTTGALDSSFDTSALQNSTSVRDLRIQPDGKIVAAIDNFVYRFNPDSSGDTSFHPPMFVNATLTPSTSPGSPLKINLYADGRLLVGGVFTDVDPAGSPSYAHFGVVRLLSDGNVDSTFVSSHRTGNETVPSAFARLDDGSTLIAFPEKIDPPITYNLGRLSSDGSLDPNFTLSSSDPNRFLNGFSARGLERLSNGDFFVYGVNANDRTAYGKVSPSGVEDTTFATNNAVVFQQATLAPDGKIVVSAGTDPDSTVYYPLARLQADGQTDSLSAPDSVHFSQVIRDGAENIAEMYVGSRVLAIQPDGKILFEYFAQDRRFHFVRLNADGSFDGTFAEVVFDAVDAMPSFVFVFDPVKMTNVRPFGGVWSATSALQDAYIQGDGRIILTGHFTGFGNSSAQGIVRIEPDGTVDNTFNPGAGAEWVTTTQTDTFFPTVENIEPLTDGTFLVTGTFEAFDGTPAPGIAHLNADGSVDTSFVAPVQRDKRSRVASAFKAQPDGSFLLSGPYSFGGNTHSLIRLVLAKPGAVNISTRLGVGTDENVLIEGFIVQGPAGSTKKILVRGIGPSLGQFSVSDPLANPILEIHDDTNAIVATNNDWQNTEIGGLITGPQAAEIAATNLAPGNELEAAIIANLPPGRYTAVVRGAGNTSGTGVVDAYDLSPGSAARLANIATRGLIHPGDQLMIAGFIVQHGPVKVVVNALGPSLKPFGVSNALPDTTLQLRNQQGAILLENDDWESDQKEELQNTGLQPSHPLEAALVTIIAPGQYTAHVRGKGNDSGIGVVQVFFLE